MIDTIKARQLMELVNGYWKILNEEDFIKIAMIFNEATERAIKEGIVNYD